MKPRVAINGFGRIGRLVFRVNIKKDLLDVVAINDPNPAKTMAHLLKYDSNYGALDADVELISENEMKVNGKSIVLTHDRDPLNLPWRDNNIDIVVESTGAFTDREGAAKHLQAGAKKVLISAPGKNIDRTVVMGVNEKDLHAEKDLLISNASCTTNCIAPLVKVLNDALGIEKGLMTTIHSYTNDQNILDVAHKDLRRARAAALSMIPTTTGAAKTVGEVIPVLKGKLDGFSVRVPTPTVSLVDFVCTVKKSTTVEEVNNLFKDTAAKSMKGILAVSDEPLVSVDYKGSPYSSIVDSLSTMVMDGNLVKVVAWYDNEWGYSERTVEMAGLIGSQM
ncbi:type I glyceraldehyde-3-phosphate dehydrogenase [Candidatus Peregrinibacteria bacterium]|nr:type I glyceraldehyde-3-phosphate dehydrogenase [Candidatus Peregrinibacteria bacterium]